MIVGWSVVCMRLSTPLVMVQEVEERLKQEIQPLSADLSLPAGLKKKLKGQQQGGGYGGSKEASGYMKVCDLHTVSAVSDFSMSPNC